jgi:regulatory protein
MPLITDIRAVGSSRSKAGSDHRYGSGEWRLVVFDDGRRLRVDVEQMARHALEPGESVGPRVVARLEAHDAYLRARERALRLLATRPRSAEEIRERLSRHRMPEAMIRTVITDLVANRLLDDLTFARSWIARRTARHPFGARRIRWEIRRKGVAPAVIDRAFRESVAQEGDVAETEEASALALARGRLRRYRDLAPDRQARRIAALLERRAFAGGTIAKVLRALGRAEVPEDADG